MGWSSCCWAPSVGIYTAEPAARLTSASRYLTGGSAPSQKIFTEPIAYPSCPRGRRHDTFGEQTSVVFAIKVPKKYHSPLHTHANSPGSPTTMECRYTCVPPCEGAWNTAGPFTRHQSWCQHWKTHEKNMLKLRAKAAGPRPGKRRRIHPPAQVPFLPMFCLMNNSEPFIGGRQTGGDSCSYRDSAARS